MPHNRPQTDEYPSEIFDLADDFKASKTLDLQVEEDRRPTKFWIYMKNIKWQIDLRANSFECFAAYFKSPSTWSADVEFELRSYITNSMRTERFTARFCGANHVFFRPLKLHEHMSREKLKTIKVELVATVTHLSNFGMLHDYFDMLPEEHNTLLSVEGRLIRVNKQYLAMMSPFFKALFYGELGQNRDHFELPEEKFREVITFLRVIYPHRQPVTKKSLDFLLQLADRYQCQPVVDACEMFMCAHYHEYQKKTEKCFSYVEKYKMQRLLRIIVEYVSVTQTTTQFRGQTYWRDLSEKTQLATLEYMAKNGNRRLKELERRRGVQARRANIDPIDDQAPPSARLLGIADPVRNADGHVHHGNVAAHGAHMVHVGPFVRQWGRLEYH